MSCDPAGLSGGRAPARRTPTKGAHGHRANRHLLDVPAARVRDRDLCVRPSDVASRRPRREERRRDRDRRRSLEPAAARGHRNRLAGGPRRLRPRGEASRPARHRRRPAAARVRDLRRRRRRVRPLLRAGARAAARPDAAHRPLATERPSARGADRAVRRGGARHRDDGDRASACSCEMGACHRRRSASSSTERRPCSVADAGNGGEPPASIDRLRSRFVLSTFGLDLAGEGARDGDRRSAGHRRASPRGAVPHRREDASGGGTTRRRALSAPPRASRCRPRRRGSRRVRRSLPLRPTSWPTCCTRPTSS